MLAKSERLGRTDFAQFFKTGKRFHGDHVSIVFTPHPTLHASVVVSKKVSKSAVTRNRIRRRLYAQLRAALHNKHPGVFIVLVKPTFNTLHKTEANQVLQQLIGRIVKPA
jgi:ribonuclease P protein component